MKKYKPIDAIYEDIYDFDDINGTSFDTPRSGKTYTIGEYGNIVRPTHRPRITDDRVRLPSVVSRPPVHIPGIEHRHVKPSAELGNKDTDWYKGRKTPHVPRQLHKDQHVDLDGSSVLRQLNVSLDGYTRQDCRLSRPEAVDHDVLYRSLMEGVHDRSMIEKSPQVLEYERRNKIKHEGYKSEMLGKNVHVPSQADEVFMRRVNKYEEAFKQNLMVHNDIHRFESAQLQDSAYLPAPPAVPKPATAQQGYNRNRRRLHASSQLDQDISIHNPLKPYHKPRPPTAEVEIDYDHDVQEALRVEQELGLFHKKLEKQKNAKTAVEMEILRQTTAAMANSNLPGCSTPCPTPTAAVSYKSVGPVKTWNGDSAKRGLGFKSKVKREKQEPRKLDISRLPDKIRKEMKKYFG